MYNHLSACLLLRPLPLPPTPPHSSLTSIMSIQPKAQLPPTLPKYVLRHPSSSSSSIPLLTPIPSLPRLYNSTHLPRSVYQLSSLDAAWEVSPPPLPSPKLVIASTSSRAHPPSVKSAQVSKSPPTSAASYPAGA